MDPFQLKILKKVKTFENHFSLLKSEALGTVKYVNLWNVIDLLLQEQCGRKINFSLCKTILSSLRLNQSWKGGLALYSLASQITIIHFPPWKICHLYVATQGSLRKLCLRHKYLFKIFIWHTALLSQKWYLNVLFFFKFMPSKNLIKKQKKGNTKKRLTDVKFRKDWFSRKSLLLNLL